MRPDLIGCCQPNYKEEYYRLQEELIQVKKENERLREAIVNIAIKM